jgi:hypothetical protein
MKRYQLLLSILTALAISSFTFSLIIPSAYANPQVTVYTCTVTAPDGLNVRVAPTVQSAIVATYPAGTVLNYTEIVEGEVIEGNPRWGHSVQGNYFWMGGTDHPDGTATGQSKRVTTVQSSGHPVG